MRPLKLYIFLIFIFIFYVESFGQRGFIRMSSQINHPGNNNFHPFISGDGLTLIYLTDYSDYGGLSMFEASKATGLWQEGTELPRVVNRPDLNFEGGYSLNYDGTFMIITSRKHGLGGFELWYSEKVNGHWSAVKNFGAPVNSALHDAAGVLTTDEQEMYFMRCAQMNETSADGCKLYYTRKKHGRWIDPLPLPENVNSYNPQIPRILGDNETLIFTSDKPGGKGGFDLYLTRKTSDGWSDPVNLEFANTQRDDKFISVPAKGRYLYTSRPGEKKSEIVQLLIPDDLKPKAVYKVSGKIFYPDNVPFDVEGIVFDAVNKKTVSRFSVDKNGVFSIALPEGTTYDVSLNPKSNEYWYYSKLYHLDSVPSRDRESLKVEFNAIESGKPFKNENLVFNPNSAVVSDLSSFELRRLAGFLHSHPELKLKIETHLYNYKEDSINDLDPDLTEIRKDTIYEKIKYLIPDHYLTTSIKDTVWVDSLETNGIVLANDIDTLFMMTEADSVYLQNPTFKLTIPALQEVVITTYHNDRTQQEAENLKNALISRGISAERIETDYIVHKEHSYQEGEIEREVILILLNQ